MNTRVKSSVGVNPNVLSVRMDLRKGRWEMKPCVSIPRTVQGAGELASDSVIPKNGQQFGVYKDKYTGHLENLGICDMRSLWWVLEDFFKPLSLSLT